MLWHRHYVHVEFVDRRTYPVRWWSRQIAGRWWAAKFCSRIRNIYRRVSSVFASASTWNVNRGGKFLIEGSRCRILMDLFCSHRAIVPKSWSLFGFIFAMKAVFIRNSMAWWHLSSERHRLQICWFLDRLLVVYPSLILIQFELPIQVRDFSSDTSFYLLKALNAKAYDTVFFHNWSSSNRRQFHPTQMNQRKVSCLIMLTERTNHIILDVSNVIATANQRCALAHTLSCDKDDVILARWQ